MERTERNGLHVCERADVVCEDRYLLCSGSWLLLCLCRRLLRLLTARIEEAAASAGWRVRSGSSAAVASLSQTAFCTLLKCAESSSDGDTNTVRQRHSSGTHHTRVHASVGGFEHRDVVRRVPEPYGVRPTGRRWSRIDIGNSSGTRRVASAWCSEAIDRPPSRATKVLPLRIAAVSRGHAHLPIHSSGHKPYWRGH